MAVTSLNKVLLTRSQKLSQQLATKLAKKNVDTIIQPLFSIVAIDLQIKFPSNLQAVLITSQSAILFLKNNSLPKNILILTVGKKTAGEVRKLGYDNVFYANNSAASLLDLAREKLFKTKGLIIYLSGENITLDLAFELEKEGFLTKRIVVYKLDLATELKQQTINEIVDGNISEVYFYSQNTLIIFYQLAKKYNLLEFLSNTKIVCLSNKIADLAKNLGFLKTKIIK